MPIETRSKTRNKTHTSTTFTSGPPAQERSPARRSQAQHAQEELQSPNSCSPRIRSTQPSRTNAAGLPLHVQKSLLQDIEESGGLGLVGCGPTSTSSAKAFCLKRICNRRSNIYGEVGSERRRQVQNKVTRWKCLEQADYFLLLADLGVRPIQAKAVSTKRFSSSPPHPQKHLVLRSTFPSTATVSSRSPPDVQKKPTPGETRSTLLLPKAKPIGKSMATRKLFPLLEDDDYGT